MLASSARCTRPPRRLPDRPTLDRPRGDARVPGGRRRRVLARAAPAGGERATQRRRAARRVRRPDLLPQLGAGPERERHADPHRPRGVLREHPAQRPRQRARARQLLVRVRATCPVSSPTSSCGTAPARRSARRACATCASPTSASACRRRSSRCATRCSRSSSSSRSSRCPPPRRSASTTTGCRSTSRRRSPPRCAASRRSGSRTDILWTANVRTLRHVIEMRTAAGAEEELRLVFDQVARMMRAEAPGCSRTSSVTTTGPWVPEHRKV